MLNFLFWNINQKPIVTLVTRLVSDHRVSVLAVAESGGIDTAELLSDLNQDAIEYYLASSDSDSVAIFTKFDPTFLMVVERRNGITIHRLALPGHPEIFIGIVHLPSKLYLSDLDQSDLASRCARTVEEVERSAGHTRTVLFGDFNMNPFERGMSSSEAFHAVMDRQVASRVSRMVRKERRRLFYNPMWSKMGDLNEGPAGTYYYQSSAPLAYFWHMFDQVLVRPSLIDRFMEGRLRVITEVGDHKLLDKDGRPDLRIGSDHLPLLFSVDLPLEA